MLGYEVSLFGFQDIWPKGLYDLRFRAWWFLLSAVKTLGGRRLKAVGQTFAKEKGIRALNPKPLTLNPKP